MIKAGSLGEISVAKEFLKMGYEVYKSITDCSEYDMIVCKDGIIYKVEVKSTTTIKDGKYAVMLKSVRSNKTQNKSYNFDKTKVDFLAIYLEPEDRTIILKASEVTQLAQMTLYHKDYIGGK